MSKFCNRNLLLLSNSIMHSTKFLEWAGEDIKTFLARKDVTEVLFVPYALKDMNSYTETVQKAFKLLGNIIEVENIVTLAKLLPLFIEMQNYSKLRKPGFELCSIHSCSNPVKAVNEAQAIFIGGGNTFRLLKQLYDNKLMEPIRRRVLEHGIPYIGSSAGTNVSTASIHTTNDMPIVYPPSFAALQLVPFNINPHYVDADHNSTLMTESRAKRIQEFHEECDINVLALKEGSYLIVEQNVARIGGNYAAKLFKKNQQAVEIKVGEDVSYLF